MTIKDEINGKAVIISINKRGGSVTEVREYNVFLYSLLSISIRFMSIK